MVRRGLAKSRAEASELVTAGSVRIDGLPTPKPSTLVEPSVPIKIQAEGPRYVSRGGFKLREALDVFGIDVTGRRALDAGASTGGFTDCLLQAGVRSVMALDVGYGQLDQGLREDERVVVRERTNLRYSTPSELGSTFDLIVIDLSFISLCTVAPAIASLAEPGADVIALVKPQFEAGKEAVPRGGVVRDTDVQGDAVRKVMDCFDGVGIGARAATESPIRGAKGNREFLLWAVAGSPASEIAVPA